jgi:hypothetical protein
MHEIKMFDRSGALNLDGFSGSGADWLERYKPYMRGLEVMVVKDATSGPRHPEMGDGYKAALVNFAMIANAGLSTDEAVEAMGG